MPPGRQVSGMAQAQAQSVNLYCAHCETQLGIFENEWVRLTTTYARSKEAGTQFGTQIGERLQVVPPGGVQRSAVGCQMAEVFCRKCSNMVGQYCKNAPTPAQQEFVHQLFYKLSRTFLKDSRTNEKVDPIFAFERTPGRPRSLVRQNSIPTRWQNTPLRESSSTPATVQTTAHELNSIQVPTAGQTESNRRQSNRVVDREGRMFEIEGRLRFHDGRLIDQENFMNDISARLYQQDSVIEEQRTSFHSQEYDLHYMRDQMMKLQHSIDELRSGLLPANADNADKQPFSSSINWTEQQELLAQVFRGARDAAKEVEVLREENQRLRSQLTSDGNGTSSAEPASSEAHITNSLGKRKRNGQNVEPLRSPQSNRSAQQSSNQPQDHVQARTEIRPTSQSAEIPGASVDINAKSDKALVLAKKKGRPSRVSKAQKDSMSLGAPYNSLNDVDVPAESSARGLSQSHAESAPRGNQQQLMGLPDDINPALAAMDVAYDDTWNPPPDDEMTADPVPQQQMQFVEDPTAFDELGFSDEEDDDHDNENDQAQTDEIDNTQASETINNAIGLRDGRSTAPEPFLKPKAPANRTRTYITLDRVHIATPWTFWTAIANGQQPKLLKPPAIQTRKKDLEDELVALGLQEWIGRDKKSKEYRDAVDAARTRLRNEKRAALLVSRGLKPAAASVDTNHGAADQPAVLSSIQNVRAIEPALAEDSEMISGDENSQSTSTSQRKGSEAPTMNGQHEQASSSRPTRRRAQRASNGSHAAVDVCETTIASDLDEGEDRQQKRTRKPTERARNQRNSDASTSQAQHDVPKKTRGRSRKSAPVDVPVTSTEGHRDESVSTPVAAVPSTELVATTNSMPVNGSASPTMPANKQLLLEKMRLKAQQKDQLREEMIKARDRMAEETMAALEMEEVTA